MRASPTLEASPRTICSRALRGAARPLVIDSMVTSFAASTLAAPRLSLNRYTPPKFLGSRLSRNSRASFDVC